MSISCKDIIDSYKGFKVRAVTKSKDNVVLWEGSDIQFCTDDYWRRNIGTDCRAYVLFDIEITEFMGKEPKDCIYVVEEPIDYSKWIGKLCRFWLVREENSKIRVLKSATANVFQDESDNFWSHCRPIRPDEVKFVEE